MSKICNCNSSKVLSFLTCKNGHYLCETCLTATFKMSLNNKQAFKCYLCDDEYNYDVIKYIAKDKYFFEKYYHKCNPFNMNDFLNNEDNYNDYLFFKFINKDAVDTSFTRYKTNYSIPTLSNEQEEVKDTSISISSFDENLPSFDEFYCKNNNCDSLAFFNNDYCTFHSKEIETNNEINNETNDILKENNVNLLNKKIKSKEIIHKIKENKHKDIKTIKLNTNKKCVGYHKKGCCKKYNSIKNNIISYNKQMISV
jgi:hypothetical protein